MTPSEIPKEIKDQIEAEAKESYTRAEFPLFVEAATFGYSLALPEINRLNFELKELGYDLMRGREPEAPLHLWAGKN